MGPYLDSGVFEYLQQILNAQATALLACQSGDGLWHTLLDDSSSYTETSGSAAIAAGILHSVRRGVAGIVCRSCPKSDPGGAGQN